MRSVAVAMVLLLGSAAWGEKLPFNVKTGLWETTSTHTMQGELPMSPELMAKLTPEQRARVEAALKGEANNGKPTTRTYKSCLTKEQLDRGTAFNNTKECTETPVTSTTSKLTVKMTCETEGMKANGTVEFAALSSDYVKGTGHMTVNGGGHTMTTDSTFDSKWLGSDCGSVK